MVRLLIPASNGFVRVKRLPVQDYANRAEALVFVDMKG
jgi:hypothetical protein